MLATVHLLFGGAIGKHFSSVWLIILLATLSHYILDFIPHYSLEAPKGCKKKGLRGCKKKELILKGIEPLLGIILMLFLIFSNKEDSFRILLGAFFGLFPDLLCYISWKKDIKWTNKVLPRTGTKFYHKMQNPKGFMMQGLFFLIGLIFFLIK